MVVCVGVLFLWVVVVVFLCDGEEGFCDCVFFILLCGDGFIVEVYVLVGEGWVVYEFWEVVVGMGELEVMWGVWLFYGVGENCIGFLLWGWGLGLGK